MRLCILKMPCHIENSRHQQRQHGLAGPSRLCARQLKSITVQCPTHRDPDPQRGLAYHCPGGPHRRHERPSHQLPSPQMIQRPAAGAGGRCDVVANIPDPTERPLMWARSRHLVLVLNSLLRPRMGWATGPRVILLARTFSDMSALR